MEHSAGFRHHICGGRQIMGVGLHVESRSATGGACDSSDGVVCGEPKWSGQTRLTSGESVVVNGGGRCSMAWTWGAGEATGPLGAGLSPVGHPSL